jgi:hypothetical protein
MALTLLEKVLAARKKEFPNEKLSKEFIEEAEVLIAWLNGEVDTNEAAKALGINHTSAVPQKTGTILRILRQGGYITITWNPPLPTIDS